MPSQRLRLSSLVSILLVLAFSLPPGAQAQAARRAPARHAAAVPRVQVDPALARAPGERTRVIVKLRASFQPEGTLSGALAVQSQRAGIDRAQGTLLGRLRAPSVTTIHTLDSIPYLVLAVDHAGLQALAASPEVASIVEDLPEPPLMDISNGLIGSAAAWSAGATGSGQTVAILDTGVDTTHPFLSGKVVAEGCYSNASGLGVGTSLCPGGVAESTATGAGVNCSTAISGCEHGTHVAGTVAGRQLTTFNADTGSNVTIAGVAPSASLIAMQVFTQFNTTADCGGGAPPCIKSYTGDQLKALDRVYALRTTYTIAAINMSLGGGLNTVACDSDSRKAAIDNLSAAGIATVIASGNAGSTTAVSAPGCISTAITVGSSTSSGAADAASNPVPADRVSYFSNSAAMVDLLAPGHFIFSSIPGSAYASMAGTSMATPHVAGAWALLKSAVPNASVAAVLSTLSSTGVAITDSKNGIAKPRIKVDSALNALFPAPTNLTASRVAQNQIGLSWSQTNAYETNFKLERSPDGVSGWSQIATPAQNATSADDTTVSCNTPYYYRVRAANSSYNSPYSTTANTTTICAPTAPSGLSAVASAQSKINLTWTDNASNETGFKLERSPDGISGWSQIATPAQNATSASDTGLTCGTSYAYRVRATNAGGNSTASASATATTSACAPLTSIAPTSLSFGSQQVGTTSTPKSVTLTNTGSTSLSLSTITVSGDFARSGGTCPTSFPVTLAAGAACTISTIFTPSAAGARTGAVSISSTANGSPHAVSLTGSGTSATFFNVFLPLITGP